MKIFLHKQILISLNSFGVCALVCSSSLLAPSPSSAATKNQDCAPVQRIKLGIEVTSENIANANTVKMANGAPYLPKKLLCASGVCKVQTESKTKIVYEPNNPAADSKGNVKLPDIDVAEEEATLQYLTREYAEAAKSCAE